VGRPTVFVRLTGCPLRCHYCDSEYAFHGGSRMDIEDILSAVTSYRCRYVCVTGGEPLAQPECVSLLSRLCDEGFTVSLETSGAMPVDGLDERISIVMDLKTPDSGELDKNRYENLAVLSSKDQVKFVLCSRSDFDWAMFKLQEYSLSERVGEVLFSPSKDQIDERELAEWILEARAPVRFQFQLHKYLWGDKPGV
jgi:7-carboxy-7-deazaguanine synthase